MTSAHPAAAPLIVVGLGNPGSEYAGTPHNLGFEVVDELARRGGIRLRVREAHALTGRGQLDGRRVVLAQPQTFMNLSGVAVRQLLAGHEAGPGDLLVVVDELALPLGRLRLRDRGSAGTHNGMRSVVDALGTQAFARLRLGIAPDHPLGDATAWVLHRWSRAQAVVAGAMVAAAADAVEWVLRDGMARAMTRVNAPANEPGEDELPGEAGR